MGASLTDDDALNRLSAAGAGGSGTAEHVKLILIASAVAGDGIEVGFAGAKGGPKVFKAAFEDTRNRPTQCVDLRTAECV